MYEVKRFKSRRYRGAHPDEWIWIRITKKEAASLIKSLAAQIEKNDPNSGRIEAQWTNKDRDKNPSAKGFISICVQEDFRCGLCGDEIEPWTGKTYNDMLLCKKCSKKICPYCHHIVHSSHCHKSKR